MLSLIGKNFGIISLQVLLLVVHWVKDEQPTIVEQIFDNLCSMTLSIRNRKAELVLGKLRKVEGAIIDIIEQ